MKKTAKKGLSVLLAVISMFLFSVITFAAVMGDVDNSGSCTAADARLILRVSVGLETFTNEQKNLGDMDGDNTITASDARLALRKSVGLVDSEVKKEPTVVPAGNEYDILASGTYYFTGTVINAQGQETPTVLAITKNSTYMQSDFDGTTVGMLVVNKKLYMINEEKKSYVYVDPVSMNLFKISLDEFSIASNFKPLSTSVADGKETINGVECNAYRFSYSDGSYSRVFLNGTKLVRITVYNSSNTYVTRTDFTSVSATVPASKRNVPVGYKSFLTVVAFMADLMNVKVSE